MTDWGDYTPGPWHVERDEAIGTYWVEDACGDFNAGPYESEPLARLIAKAYLIPRLEAALDGLLEDHEAMCRAHNKDDRPSRCNKAAAARQALAELRSGL